MLSPTREDAPALRLLRDRVDPREQVSPFRDDPVGFISEQLHEYAWSKQREICESVRDHVRTAVPSAFDSGKSFVAARLAAWWIEAHPPGSAMVVTTAPTFVQVRAILWQEIATAHARGGLSGRVNQTEWWQPVEGHEKLVGFGRKPDEHSPAAFQGIHARYVLVIMDEADGVPQSLYDAAEGLITNEGARLLLIGNPWDPAGPFAKACSPGSGYNVISIPASATPNFSGEDVPDSLRSLLLSPEWVEDKKQRWGIEDPRYISKVLAEFPEDAEGVLIPFSWITAAQRRTLEPSRPIELGVDVAWLGDDATVICKRWGPVARIVKVIRKQDTQAVAGHVWIQFYEKRDITAIKVDVSPPGVFDALRAADVPVGIVGLNFGWAATDPEAFVNARAEWFWELREMFHLERIDIDPRDDELAAELASIRLLPPDSRGRVRLESKEDARKRGVHSPDRADALVLAFTGGGLGYMAPKLAPKGSGRSLPEEQGGPPGGELMDETEVGF